MFNRFNYIYWIEDFLVFDIIEKKNVDEVKVRGFDIGIGANCIYFFFGAFFLGWNFIGLGLLIRIIRYFI